MFLLTLICLFLIGIVGGWFLRGRRAVSQLSRQRVLHTDCQLQLEEMRTAFMVNARELKTLQVEQHRESQLQVNNQSASDTIAHPLDERRAGPRRVVDTTKTQIGKGNLKNIASSQASVSADVSVSSSSDKKLNKQSVNEQRPLLAKVAKQQQAIIQQHEAEQLKLNKSITALHKKYLTANAEKKQLHVKIASALEAPNTETFGKKTAAPIVDQIETKSADELASDVRKLHTQAQQSQQLRNDYETINNKYVASTARVSELELSLTRVVGAEQLESEKQERQQHVLEIDELKRKIALAEEDKNRISMLEEDLKKAERNEQATKEKLNSLQSEVRELTQRKGTLVTEKDDSDNNVVNQELTISSLEGKNQEYQTQLSQLHDELVARDEKMAGVLDEIERQESKVKQLQGEQETREAADKMNRSSQDDQIVSLAEKLNESTSEIELLNKDLGQLEPLQTELELYREEKLELLAKLENTAHENQALLNKQEVADGKLTVLGNQVRLFDGVKRDLKEQLTSLQKDNKAIAELQAVASESENSLKAATKEISNLYEALASVQKDNKTIPGLQAAASESEKRLKAAANEISSLHVELASVQKDNKAIPELQAAASESENRLKAAANEISSLHVELASVQKDNKTIPELQAAASESEKRLKAAANEISSLHVELAGVQNDNKAIPELQASAIESENKLEVATNEISNLQVELASVKKDNKTIPAMQVAVSELENKLKVASDEISNLQVELVSVQKDNKTIPLLQSATSESENELKAAANEISRLRVELASVQTDNKSIPELKIAVSESENKLKAAANEISSLHVELVSVKNENKTIAELKSVVSNSENSLKAATSEISNLYEELTSVRKDNKTIPELKAAASESENRLKAAGNEISSLQVELARVQKGNKTIPELKATASESENKLKAAGNEISSLQVELARVQKDNKTIPELKIAASESENRLKAVTNEISNLHVELKNKAQLDETLKARERNIVDLRKQQAQTSNEVQITKQELIKVKSSLTKCSAALSDRTIESQRLAAQLGDQRQLQNKLDQRDIFIENMQKQLSASQELPAEIAKLEEKLKIANTENNSQQALLRKKAELENTLQRQEREITDLHNKQTVLEENKRELDKAKASLAQSSAALSGCAAESQRLSAKLKNQQELQDTLKDQGNVIQLMRNRVVNFDALKLELTMSKESHEQLRKMTPDIEALREQLKKIESKNSELLEECSSIPKLEKQLAGVRLNHKELKAIHKDMGLQLELVKKEKASKKRKATIDMEALRKRLEEIEGENRDLLKECANIPKLEKQLAKVRLNHKELKAIHKNMGLQLESVKKENTSNKRKATILYRQANPSTVTTVHLKRSRGETTKIVSDQNTKAKKSAAKKKSNKAKQGIRKSVSGQSSKRSVTKKIGSKKRLKTVSDDLKKIHGIGPVLEELLNKNGITRFEHLAKLDRNGVETLSAKLGSFSNRINRDGWVKSAAKLAKNRGT